MVVAIPGRGIRFVVDECRPYVHSLNLRIETGRVIYISDCGVGQTNLPLASQIHQDEYAWVMKSDCKIDQGMPWSNAMAYGVAHDLIPYEEVDLRFLTLPSGVTLYDVDLWQHWGDCFIQLLGWPKELENQIISSSDTRDALGCQEAVANNPAAMRKLNFF